MTSLCHSELNHVLLIFQVISFSFIAFDLQFSAGRYGGCVADTLEIFENSDEVPMARLCGNDLPNDMETNGNFAEVRFRTDESINGNGDNIITLS